MNCRFGAKHPLPSEIPARTAERLSCVVEPQGPGPFSGQLHLFVADPNTREIVLTVQGKAKDAKTELR